VLLRQRFVTWPRVRILKILVMYFSPSLSFSRRINFIVSAALKVFAVIKRPPFLVQTVVSVPSISHSTRIRSPSRRTSYRHNHLSQYILLRLLNNPQILPLSIINNTFFVISFCLSMYQMYLFHLFSNALPIITLHNRIQFEYAYYVIYSLLSILDTPFLKDSFLIPSTRCFSNNIKLRESVNEKQEKTKLE